MSTQNQKTGLLDSFDLTLLRYYQTHVRLRPPTVIYKLKGLTTLNTLYNIEGGFKSHMSMVVAQQSQIKAVL